MHKMAKVNIRRGKFHQDRKITQVSINFGVINGDIFSVLKAGSIEIIPKGESAEEKNRKKTTQPGLYFLC
jgi:hypothetical protein